MAKIIALLIALLLTLGCFAQAPPPPTANQPMQPAPLPAGLAQPLVDLRQIANTTVSDLQEVRVDKWKANDDDKDRARSNIESLQRNLTAALPALEQQVRANPLSVAAVVKLYRNMTAVFDVLASVTESAGAFGNKSDYQQLATDTRNLDNVRRSLADQLEQMAENQDAQIGRLTAQLRAQQAASSPPKRVIVDDNAPASKTSKSKKKTSSSRTQ